MLCQIRRFLPVSARTFQNQICSGGVVGSRYDSVPIGDAGADKKTIETKRERNGNGKGAAREEAAPRRRRRYASPVFRSQTASGRAPPVWVVDGGAPRADGWGDGGNCVAPSGWRTALRGNRYHRPRSVADDGVLKGYYIKDFFFYWLCQSRGED